MTSLKHKTIPAHRLAWLIAHEEIPEALFVLHSCDNPPCCNPSHLFLGTHTDNMRDKMKKGRANHVENETHFWTTVPNEIVQKIRDRYAQDHSVGAQARLAREFHLNPRYIQKIVRGNRRKGI